jgi:hypothetical protein
MKVASNWWFSAVARVMFNCAAGLFFQPGFQIVPEEFVFQGELLCFLIQFDIAHRHFQRMCCFEVPGQDQTSQY